MGVDRFAETLEVYNFALTQEFDRIAYIGIIRKAQNIVIRFAGFLFGGKILIEIGVCVARDLKRAGCEGDTGSSLRVNAGAVVDKIGVEAAAFNLLRGEAAGELMDDCGHHFDMRQFFRPMKLSVDEHRRQGGSSKWNPSAQS